MPGPLPPGEQIPIPFSAGAPLTEADLNLLQHTLLWRILFHTHNGTDGVKLGSEALQDGAVGTAQIAMHAVTRDRLGPAAVGPAELGPAAVTAGHLAPNAVVTPVIGNDQVTLEKLSPDIRALLNKPTLGATSYAYILYLDAPIIFTGIEVDGPWWQWLVTKNAKRPSWKWDMARLQDDGTLQPIDYLRNPRLLDRKKPTTRLPTMFAMEASLSRMTRTERTDATMLEMFRELGPETVGKEIAGELTERKRVTFRFNPKETRGLDTSVSGEMLLNPGIGSNAPFSPDGRARRFSKGIMPDAEGRATIQNIIDNFDMDLNIQRDEQMLMSLLDVSAFIDFVNGPWLMPIGYWTASSRNISAVTRKTSGGPHRVRITFATPYKEPNYAVTVTPDAGTNLSDLRVPMVLTRTKEYCEITFLPVTTGSSKVSFSIAIFGDLQGT